MPLECSEEVLETGLMQDPKRCDQLIINFTFQVDFERHLGPTWRQMAAQGCQMEPKSIKINAEINEAKVTKMYHKCFENGVNSIKSQCQN